MTGTQVDGPAAVSARVCSVRCSRLGSHRVFRADAKSLAVEGEIDEERRSQVRDGCFDGVPEDLFGRAQSVGRHLGFAGVGKQIIRANGWDQGAMDAISHKVKGIDQHAHRHQMLDLARELPREWIETGAVVGSPEHCAHRLREYLDAGLDEICLHGVAPDQCRELVEAWHGGAISRARSVGHDVTPSGRPI